MAWKFYLLGHLYADGINLFKFARLKSWVCSKMENLILVDLEKDIILVFEKKSLFHHNENLERLS